LIFPDSLFLSFDSISLCVSLFGVDLFSDFINEQKESLFSLMNNYPNNFNNIYISSNKKNIDD